MSAINSIVSALIPLSVSCSCGVASPKQSVTATPLASREPRFAVHGLMAWEAHVIQVAELDTLPNAPFFTPGAHWAVHASE